MLDQPIAMVAGLRVGGADIDRLPRYGVELEYENVNMGNVRERWLNGWQLVRDGSLRNNGVELISPPSTYNELRSGLRRIIGNLTEHTNVRATPRCGIHVHVNQRYATIGQVLSHAALYGFMEPSLFAQYAPGRQDSAFCVPQYNNTLLIDALRRMMGEIRRDHAPLLNLFGCNKYSAVNYSTLTAHGTIEYRQLHSSLDPDEIIAWLAAVRSISEAAMRYNDPVQVVDDFEAAGLARLQRDLLGVEIEVDPIAQLDAEHSTMIWAAEPDNMNGMEINLEVA